MCETVRNLLDMLDAFSKKVASQKSKGRQDNMTLMEQRSTLQKDKEKCESDRSANVDQFMAGQLHKDIY